MPIGLDCSLIATGAVILASTILGFVAINRETKVVIEAYTGITLLLGVAVVV
jgi:hypothetical protein